jgi:cytochrome c oxidase subunit 1
MAIHQEQVEVAHKESFITKYIFSTDHKTIARQYLITGIIWGIIGMILSWLMRLQLAYPNQPMPFLEKILGRWAEGGILKPEFYIALITMHGTIMVFFLLTAGLSGTFSNYLIPLQIGARDMAFPVLNMLSYWVFFAASVVMLISFFVQTGPAAAGWTMYPPLSALKNAIPGAGVGATLWLISMALFIVSSLLGSLNYITTTLNFRTKGMSMGRLPITVWGMLVTAILGLLSFPVLLAGAVMLIFDREFGTSFFVPGGLVLGGQPVPHEGGNPILWQHLFWFLGHPEVYIVAIPAFSLVGEILATNARKPLFAYKVSVGSIIGIGALSMIVWGHHMYVSGMNPILGEVFVVTTLAISFPTAILVFNYIVTIWRGNLRFTPAMLFALGFLGLFIPGALTGAFLATAPVDIQLHDTYFVVAHFHFTMATSAAFGMYAGVYHWFPKMFGRMMNDKLGKIHFWGSFIGVYLVFFPMFFKGIAGVPRRYYSFTEYEFTSQFVGLNKFITIAALITGAIQFLFVFNFFWSMFKGPKAEKNPWKSTTLEWQTDSPPPHGNWGPELPVVYRGPYEYSVPGAEDDYIPQTVPVKTEAR